MVPTVVDIRAALPTTTSGKVSRRALQTGRCHAENQRHEHRHRVSRQISFGSMPPAVASELQASIRDSVGLPSAPERPRRRLVRRHRQQRRRRAGRAGARPRAHRRPDDARGGFIADSLTLAAAAADACGIRAFVEDISETLAAAGCYRRRDEAIRAVVPEYGDGWRCKIVLPDSDYAPELRHLLDRRARACRVKNGESGCRSTPISASSPPRTSSSASAR